MSKRLFAEHFGMRMAVRRDFAFAGIANDAPMFSYFDRSVGVANVARFAGGSKPEPKYITRGAAAPASAELASHLLGAVDEWWWPTRHRAAVGFLAGLLGVAAAW